MRIFTAALALMCTSLASAAVEVGQEAPNFNLAGSDGAMHTLEALKGKYVVVAFFPKAYTKG